MVLRNLFKHKIPIQFAFYVGNMPTGSVVGEDGCDFSYSFESKRIHYAK